LQKPNRKRRLAAKVAFRRLDRVLQVGAQGVADSLEHAVECGQLTNRLMRNGLHDILENPQHGTFANGTLTAGKEIVLRKRDERGLQKLELIGMERIERAKIFLILEAAVSARAITKLEERFEVVLFSGVKR